MKQKSNKPAKYNFQGKFWDQGNTRPKTVTYKVEKALNSNKINLEHEKVINALFLDQNTFGNN